MNLAQAGDIDRYIIGLVVAVVFCHGWQHLKQRLKACFAVERNDLAPVDSIVERIGHASFFAGRCVDDVVLVEFDHTRTLRAAMRSNSTATVITRIATIFQSPIKLPPSKAGALVDRRDILI